MKIFTCLLLFLFCSCSEKTNDSSLQKVTLQLNWFPEAEHGGYYEALNKGYYKELGLDVEILPGGPGVRVETETAIGRVDFGIANADKILTVRDKGMDLVALMSPFEKSPRCLLVHADSSLNDFQSLQNAEVLIVNNTKPYYFWITDKYPHLKNIDTIPYNKATFMNNKNAVMQGYINSEPLILKARGIETKVLKISDTGFNPYASVLICRNDLILQQAELVEKMKKASSKGWLSYLKNPHATNAIIEQINPANKGTLNDSTAALQDLMSSQNETFGKMDITRWKELAIQLKKLSIIKVLPTDWKKLLP